MGTNSTRDTVLGLVKQAVPSKWTYVDDERTIDAIDNILFTLSLGLIKRPDKDISGTFHQVTFKATVVAPGKNMTVSEGELGDAVDQALFAFDTMLRTWKTDHPDEDRPAIWWEQAEKVLWRSSNLAFEITLQVLTAAN